MTVLREYQADDIERVIIEGCRHLIAYDMGLGKSLLGLSVMQRMHLEPTIVVCPSSLKANWLNEVTKHTERTAVVLHGTRPEKQQIHRLEKLYIVNYDILGPTRNIKRGDGWIEYLVALKPQLVILDEVQMIGDRSSARTKWVDILCRGVPHILGLSGTPITNRPAEMYPTLRILRPKQYKTFHTFAHRFCSPKRTFWGWDYSGASNLDVLHAELTAPDGVMIRRRKADVLHELPAINRIVLPLEMDNRKEYDQAQHDFLTWIKLHHIERLGKVKRAMKLTQLSYLRRLAAICKLPRVFDWIDHFLAGSDGKLLGFAIHKSIINRLEERYRSICVVIDGSKTAKERQVAEQRFQRDRRTRILFGNIKAAGVGLNLTAAHTSALIELPWKPADCTQAEARAYGRLNDIHGIDSYYLIATNSIEEKLCKLIQKKQRNIDEVLDGTTQDDSINIYDELVAEMLADAQK